MLSFDHYLLFYIVRATLIQSKQYEGRHFKLKIIIQMVITLHLFDLFFETYKLLLAKL